MATSATSGSPTVPSRIRSSGTLRRLASMWAMLLPVAKYTSKPRSSARKAMALRSRCSSGTLLHEPFGSRRTRSSGAERRSVMRWCDGTSVPTRHRPFRFRTGSRRPNLRAARPNRAAQALVCYATVRGTTSKTGKEQGGSLKYNRARFARCEARPFVCGTMPYI